MKVFQIVKQVLDQDYKFLPGSEAERDKSISASLTKLGKTYGNVLVSGGPDLSDPVTRFAYIYRYTTAHADMVYELIRNTPELRELFERELVRTACVGGGPGSDLLGIFKYVLNRSKKSELFFYLLDREAAWGESWADVDEITRSDIRTSTNFRTIDVCDSKSWAPQRKFLKADLFTFVYFFSEIFKRKAEAAPFFDNLFKSAQQGARFLYIDFRDSTLVSWFDALCERNKVRTIHGDDTWNFQVNYDEQKTDLKKYMLKFDNPKITARISFRVCVKEK